MKASASYYPLGGIWIIAIRVLRTNTTIHIVNHKFRLLLASDVASNANCIRLSRCTRSSTRITCALNLPPTVSMTCNVLILGHFNTSFPLK